MSRDKTNNNKYRDENGTAHNQDIEQLSANLKKINQSLIDLQQLVRELAARANENEYADDLNESLQDDNTMPIRPKRTIH